MTSCSDHKKNMNALSSALTFLIHFKFKILYSKYKFFYINVFRCLLISSIWFACRQLTKSIADNGILINRAYLVTL